MLYTCEKCKFIFESDKENVVQCPDCGKMKVRPANAEETEEYENRVLEDDDE